MPRSATPPGLVLAAILLPCTFVATGLSFAGDAVPDLLPREILLGAGLLGGMVAVVSATATFVGKWRSHRTPAGFPPPSSPTPPGAPPYGLPPEPLATVRRISPVSPVWLGATAVFGLLSLAGAWPLFPVALLTGLLGFRKHAAAAGVALALAFVVVGLAGLTLLYLVVEGAGTATPYDCIPQGYATDCSGY